MKHKLFTFFIALFMMLNISSCDVYTYATTQDDIYIEAETDVVRSNVSFDVIVQYGTPYYRDGVLLYYLYRDIYYYPFYYNDYWYVRAYRRPFTHFDHRPYFRPHRYDYRFRPGHYRGFDRPRIDSHRITGRPQHRPDVRPTRPNRPDVRPTRPNVRPSTPPSMGNTPRPNNSRPSNMPRGNSNSHRR